jgi:hypothetical protein
MGGNRVGGGMRRRRSGPRLALLLAMLATVLTAGPAFAERTQVGDLIAFLDGRIKPRTLPRDHLAPVGVTLDAGLQVAGETPLPRVRKITLELAWRGTLDTKGLMVCRHAQLRSVDIPNAMDACGPALVGKGSIFARVFLPAQEPFGLHADLLAFNGKTKAGAPAVWVLAYSSDPPGSVVIPFYVKHQPGPLPTVLVGVIPHSAGSWPHFARFHMSISRRFAHEGRMHSYMSASCPLPPRFTAGLFLLARATFVTEGPEITAETRRTCRTR